MVYFFWLNLAAIQLIQIFADLVCVEFLWIWTASLLIISYAFSHVLSRCYHFPHYILLCIIYNALFHPFVYCVYLLLLLFPINKCLIWFLSLFLFVLVSFFWLKFFNCTSCRVMAELCFTILCVHNTLEQILNSLNERELLKLLLKCRFPLSRLGFLQTVFECSKIAWNWHIWNT